MDPQDATPFDCPDPPDNLDQMVDDAIGFLVSHGYAEPITIDGKPGLRITEAGKKYLDDKRSSSNAV